MANRASVFSYGHGTRPHSRHDGVIAGAPVHYGQHKAAFGGALRYSRYGTLKHAVDRFADAF